jgi:hypothetical protein
MCSTGIRKCQTPSLTELSRSFNYTSTATVLICYIHYCLPLAFHSFVCMARTPSPSTQPASASFLPSRNVPLSTSSVEVSLVPPPLSSRSTRERFLQTSARTGNSLSVTTDAKEHSQDVVRSRSLRAHTKEHVEETFYRCTLCYCPLARTSKAYTFPEHSPGGDAQRNESPGRVFCKSCWIWIYDLSICWTCGEIVGRMEERVGFGWCWWHWGCLGCLICKVCCYLCVY